ncbi:TonB-dependent receptor plug domain-containing protein [Kozakia baliensis]|uniref:TonB-dependent receptor plug domain-containing protein n=1 Tax=Kozakia baliensis TaxID=153496 RepID=UPI000879D884|nr:TonB-dependent receptor [Kozakia baliensis]AOX20849.1 TonB-dependent receptor [Kozakia baliensis]
MFSNTKRVTHMSFAVMIAAAGICEHAQAQTASQTEQQGKKTKNGSHTVRKTSASKNAASRTETEQVIVTGTRGSVRALKSMSPIVTVSPADIRRTGQTNIRNALSLLDPSVNNTPGYPGQLGFTTKTASLRGLPANETLVLVNGKRRHTMSSLFYGGAMQGQSPVDLDLIPMSAIDHIEILKDGAAAQYGSDAIAGVINIITKKSPSGGSAELSYNQYGQTIGSLGDYGRGGNFFFNNGFALGHQGGYFNFSADIVGNQWSNTAGYAPLSKGGVPTLLYPLLANGRRDPREYGNRYRQLYGVPETEKQAVSYDMALPLSNGVEFYSFATYAHRTAYEPGWYRPSNSSQNILSVYPEGYLPIISTEDQDFQFTSGFRGKDFFGWKWDASVNFGRDQTTPGLSNSINVSLGPNSPHNFTLGTLVNSELTADFDISRKFDTGLFKYPLAVSGGLEYRYNQYQISAGEPAAWEDGGYIFSDGTKALPSASGLGAYYPSQAGTHSRMNGAFYLELDQKLTDKFSIQLSGRNETYSDFGNTLSGKVSARYQVTPWIALRGSASNGFHAPTLQQEHFQSAATYYTTLAQENNALVTTTNQYASVNSVGARALGASALKPETSHNFGVGFVLTPFKNFDASVDIYRIDIFNQIVPLAAQGTGITGRQVMDILHESGAVPNNGQYYVYTFMRNAAHTVTEGLDLQAHYLTDFGRAGRVRWSVMMNQQQHSIKRINPLAKDLGASVQPLFRNEIGNLTTIYPRNTLRLSGTWFAGPVATTLRVSRYSATKNLSNQGTAYDETVAPAWLFDLDLTYNFSTKWAASIGGTNIFNKRPAVLNAKAQSASSLYQINPNYSTASIYGAEGGYYYAKVRYTW